MSRIFLWQESNRLSLGEISKTVAFPPEAGLWPDINRDFNIPVVSILILPAIFWGRHLQVRSDRVPCPSCWKRRWKRRWRRSSNANQLVPGYRFGFFLIFPPGFRSSLTRSESITLVFVLDVWNFVSSWWKSGCHALPVSKITESLPHR